jgi:Kdo2-lipid IVA lauroyltransferase/acyltransferase
MTRFSRFGLGVGSAVGKLAYLLGFRRKVALDGLRRAFPDLSERERRRIALAAYGQLGTSLAEIALARTVPDSALEHLVQFRGLDRVLAALGKGRGVVVAVAHYGNWELLARAAVRRGIPVTAITRPLRGAANRRLLQARREGGLRELPDKSSTEAALAVLRRGEALAIVVDQNMRPRRGIFVDFFGAQACTTPAAAVLSLRARAPLFAVFPVRQPDGTHVVDIQGPFETGLRGHAAVVALTQELTFAVERAVRAHPDHWFWVHRRWKTRPSLAPTVHP